MSAACRGLTAAWRNLSRSRNNCFILTDYLQRLYLAIISRVLALFLLHLLLLISRMAINVNTNTDSILHTMKYAILALAVSLVAVSCRTQQPAPTPPPMVDMGYRSGK